MENLDKITAKEKQEKSKQIENSDVKYNISDKEDNNLLFMSRQEMIKQQIIFEENLAE